MFGLGSQELLVTLVIVLVLFGAKRLANSPAPWVQASKNSRRASTRRRPRSAIRWSSTPSRPTATGHWPRLGGVAPALQRVVRPGLVANHEGQRLARGALSLVRFCAVKGKTSGTPM